jgi:hypothetical protein
VKKALIILLVVFIVVTGVPLIVGAMGMSGCHECGPAVAGPTGCAAVLLAAAFMIMMLMELCGDRRFAALQLLRATALDPPPQLI